MANVSKPTSRSTEAATNAQLKILIMSGTSLVTSVRQIFFAR